MVRLFVANESESAENRVAGSPETIAKLLNRGIAIGVQEGAGAASFLADEEYRKVGAKIIAKSEVASELGKTDILVKVGIPTNEEIEALKTGSVSIGHLEPSSHLEIVRKMAEAEISFLSMNLVPRTTRAQKIDALSSQANIAGYKAALIAAGELPKYFPMMMTAAGTVKPAKVVVMGAGVAGLQAIATAKRLGAQVFASDVRLSAKEQVESLGAKFIDVPSAEDFEDESGYAKEVTKEFLEKQQEVVSNHVMEADAVITTALVAGRKPPILISSTLVGRMRPGSVIVDLACDQGGNCAETVAGKTVVKNGVSILGPSNISGTVSVSATELYSRNVLELIFLLVNSDGELAIDLEDDVVDKSLLTHRGKVHHQATARLMSETKQELQSSDKGAGNGAD